MGGDPPCRPGSRGVVMRCAEAAWGQGNRALLSPLSLGPDPARIGFCVAGARRRQPDMGSVTLCPGWRTGSEEQGRLP